MPDKNIENIERALWILWAWNFNPECLTSDDLDWFGDYIIKKYAKNPTTPLESSPKVGGDNLPRISEQGQSKV